MKSILVISPHPDDESIGCGGTILKHLTEQDQVTVVFLTSGEKGGHGRSEEETRSLRETEARSAAQILGLNHLEFWGIPDGSVRATQTLIEKLRNRIEDLRVDTIYVTHGQEMHPDHRASARLVQKTVRTLPEGITKPRVLMFEVWTPLQVMDEIVEITPHLEQKMAAIRAYKCQCAEVGFDEAIAGLNRYRGEMHSWPEGEYAEVFAEQKP